jgi:membrane protein YqaA with SNARE-associated domain
MNAFDLPAASTAALWAATFLFALGSGLVPFVFNTELYILGVAVLTDASPAAIIALMTAGQMLGKFAVYEAGRGSLNVKWIQRRAASKAAAAFARRPANGFVTLALSSVTGVPPFYAVSFMAGALRLPAAAFLAIGTTGRVIRFTAVFLFPGLFR